MRSLFSGVSGLKAHQTRMDVIGNNIANVNTTGFKSSRTTFSDTLSQTQSGASSATETRGGVNPKQIGLGVGVSSIDLIFTDSSATSTGKNTDLALSGNGLFVVGQGTSTYYTRNGAFEFDEEGNYVLPGSGLYVKGWMEQDGVINTSAAVTNIQIPSGKAMDARATTQVNYTSNLNASTLMISTITQGGGTPITATGTTATASPSSPLLLKMTDGTEQTVTSGTYTVGHSIPLTTTFTEYDSLGNQHTIPILYEKVGTTAMTTDGKAETVSVWKYSLAVDAGTTALPGRAIVENNGTIALPSFISSGSTNITGGKYVNEGYIAFDTDGQLVSGKGTIHQATGDITDATFVSSVMMYVTYFNSMEDFVDAGGKAEFDIDADTDKIDYVASNGAAMGEISVGFNGVNQYSGSSTIFGAGDGYAAGTLQSVNIDNAGVITGTYTNGQRRSEAQVAVAQFNNPSGLTKTGNSLYQESDNSGVANIKSAAGLGVTITPAALEMSNVDIANEFSDMIITQRGFQSNSKMVTVGDEMLETLINMKR